MRNWDVNSWIMVSCVVLGGTCCVIAALAHDYGAITLIVGVVVTAITSLRNSQKIDSTTAKVEEVHNATNSMKDALVAGASREGFIAGVKAQQDKEKLPPPQSNEGMQ